MLHAGGESQSTKIAGLPPVMFNPQRRAASPALKAAVRSLIARLEKREADLKLRQRARKEEDRAKFWLAVEAIAVNLAGLAMLEGNRALAVPRSSGVMWKPGRYANPVYGQHFLAALDLMAHPKVGLLDDLTRGYSFANGDKLQTTVRPTAALFDHVPPTLIDWAAFSRAEEPEVLILKGEKQRKSGRAEIIEYRDTAMTRRRRKEIQRINAALEAAPMSLATNGNAVCLTEDGHPIDPTRRSLRRIFNNGKWSEGGRLFDGFWETMRRADRFKFLRIGTAANPEGEGIANVDFSQLFPTLAYHRIGCEPPNCEDLYDICGNGTSRDGWKRLVNALLFATSPLKAWPSETSSCFPTGMKLKKALALITSFHAPIAPLFGTGVGFRLMLIESEILIRALQQLSHEGVTALPLHDSVLVARSEAEPAKRIMEIAFAEFYAGARAKLKIDFG